MRFSPRGLVLRMLGAMLIAGLSMPTSSSRAESAWEAYQRELAILPAGDNRALVAANCGACHSLQLVAQNHMQRAAWDRTLTWMQDKQKMWELPTPIRDAILTYLATYFGDASQGQAAGFDFRPTNPLPEALEQARR